MDSYSKALADYLDLQRRDIGYVERGFIVDDVPLSATPETLAIMRRLSSDLEAMVATDAINA